MSFLKENTREYWRVHGWIKRKLPKPTKCEVCNTEEPVRYDWALKKGFDYECKAENFMPLCRSCHRKYDFTEEHRQRISIRMKGNTINQHQGVTLGKSPFARIIGQYSKSGEFIRSHSSIKGASAIFGKSPALISQCLSGVVKTAYGYQWTFLDGKPLRRTKNKESRWDIQKKETIDKCTGFVFDSVKEACKALNINLNSEKGRMLYRPSQSRLQYL